MVDNFFTNIILRVTAILLFISSSQKKKKKMASKNKHQQSVVSRFWNKQTNMNISCRNQIHTLVHLIVNKISFYKWLTRKIQPNLLKCYKIWWVCFDCHITKWKRESVNEIYCTELSIKDSCGNKWWCHSCFPGGS